MVFANVNDRGVLVVHLGRTKTNEKSKFVASQSRCVIAQKDTIIEPRFDHFNERRKMHVNSPQSD